MNRYWMKWMGLLVVAFLMTGLSLAMALSLQQEMKKLQGLSGAVQKVAREGEREAATITDERLDTALTKFAEIARALDAIKIHAPQGAADHPQADEFRAAYKSRIEALGILFGLLQAEFAAQRALEPEKRNYMRAGKISAQIDACRNRSHDDFMGATPIAALGPETCRFPETP